MARKMKKFSAGGAQGRYDYRMADIKKDFEKDSKGKSGRALEVLEAKRAQRIADAEDDRAKRMGLDRTATRKAEYDAEKNLSRTRKFGADKPAAAAAANPDMVAQARAVAAADAPAAEKAKAKPQSFGAAFQAARAKAIKEGRDPNKEIFTWGGKKKVALMATAPKPAQRTNNSAGASSSSANNSAGTSSSSANTGTAAAAAAKAKQDTAAKAAVDARYFNRSGTDTTPTVRQNFVARNPQAEAAIAKEKADKAAKEKAARDKEKAARDKEKADRAALAKAQAIARRTGRPVQRTGVKLAKGGAVKKKGTTMKYAKGGATPANKTPKTPKEPITGGSNTVPLTPERKEFLKELAKRNAKPGMAKGGKAKSFAATKFGKAMVKKSADTKGRAMVKKAGGGKCYASGGSVSSASKRADGIAKKGKTKTSMTKMKKGGSC